MAADSLPATWWQRRRINLRARKRAAAGYDLGWMRVLLCATAALMSANFIGTPAWVRVAASIDNLVFGVLLCIYFGHILLRRLQCSLLEFSVLMIVLGNVAGLILTTPGAYYLGMQWLTALLAIVVGWVLFGAVGGLTQARLLNAASPLVRILFMFAGWVTTASPALLTGGLLLLLLPKFELSAMVSPNMAVWGIPLTVLGLIGCGLHGWLSWKVRRAARAILNEL